MLWWGRRKADLTRAARLPIFDDIAYSLRECGWEIWNSGILDLEAQGFSCSPRKVYGEFHGECN